VRQLEWDRPRRLNATYWEKAIEGDVAAANMVLKL
jgi:hypothetical protein